jgi:hypothetical protein
LKNNHPNLVKPIFLDFVKYKLSSKIVNPIVPIMLYRVFYLNKKTAQNLIIKEKIEMLLDQGWEK